MDFDKPLVTLSVTTNDEDVADLYYEGIKNAGVTLPAKLPRGLDACHLFPILCEKRDALQAYLKEIGVQTLIHYSIPPHKQNVMSWHLRTDCLSYREMGCRLRREFMHRS